MEQEINYATLENLERFLKNSKDIFLEKNAYDGIVNFPTVGKDGFIYIDRLANKIYRWDDDNLKYYCVGSDYNEIDLIDCGNSK